MEQLQKRTLSFIWRYGIFVIMAIAAYTMNVNDIREIDLNKILTIFVVVTSTYVINEGTKWINKNK